jgi:chemotaxis protein CheD
MNEFQVAFDSYQVNGVYGNMVKNRVGGQNLVIPASLCEGKGGPVNIVIGVSDMRISNDFDSVLITYSLGSCIAVAIHDPIARVGGMLHFMLPDSSLDPMKAQKNPCLFADTGIPLLFRSAYKFGAKKHRMKVIVVGGSQVLDQESFFNIGKRNYMAARKMFWKNNVMIDFEDIGGNANRTLGLRVGNGQAWVKVSGRGLKQI